MEHLHSGYEYVEDAFVEKLDTNGTLLWNTFLGSSTRDYESGIAVTGSGDIYVTNYSRATRESPVRAFSRYYGDAFVAKLPSTSENYAPTLDPIGDVAINEDAGHMASRLNPLQRVRSQDICTIESHQ